jgi:hypothetical protein
MIMAKIQFGFCLMLVLSISYAQEKDCNTNPLKEHKWCEYMWSICKKLTTYRIEKIKECIEKSQNYQEGSACFEKSWIENFLQR